MRPLWWRKESTTSRQIVYPLPTFVLDEPTNDLDTDTLEMLELMLLNFTGTLIVVSHDRTFLNNVVTSTLAFDGDGQLRAYAGGYDDWLSQRPDSQSAVVSTRAPEAHEAPLPTKGAAKTAHKLSFKEKKLLESLPIKIDELEAQVQTLQDKLNDPNLYKEGTAKIAILSAQLNAAEKELEDTMEQWVNLESLAESSR